MISRFLLTAVMWTFRYPCYGRSWCTRSCRILVCLSCRCKFHAFVYSSSFIYKSGLLGKWVQIKEVKLGGNWSQFCLLSCLANGIKEGIPKVVFSWWGPHCHIMLNPKTCSKRKQGIEIRHDGSYTCNTCNFIFCFHLQSKQFGHIILIPLTIFGIKFTFILQFALPITFGGFHFASKPL